MCIIASNITCSRQTRQPRFFSMTLSWNKARNSNTLWRRLKARFCLYLFMKTRLFTVSWQHANVAWWWPNAPSCLERNSEGCMSNDASLAYVWQWPYKYGESLGLTSSWSSSSSSSSSSQYSSSSTSSTTSSSSYSYWYWHWCSYSYSIHIHHPHHHLPSALVWRSPSVEEASPTCRTCRNNWYKKMSQCHPVSKNGAIPPKDSEGKAKPKMPHSPGELGPPSTDLFRRIRLLQGSTRKIKRLCDFPVKTLKEHNLVLLLIYTCVNLYIYDIYIYIWYIYIWYIYTHI